MGSGAGCFAASYNFITAQTITFNKSFLFMAHSITCFGTLSSAFFHVNKTHIHLFLLLIFLFFILTVNIASTIPFLGIHPNCILFKLFSVQMCFSITLSAIFMAGSNCFTLDDPQLITSSFPLIIGTIALLFYWSFYFSNFLMWPHMFFLFMIFFMCSFQIFAIFSSVKPN